LDEDSVQQYQSLIGSMLHWKDGWILQANVQWESSV
jgi:hypothetical protein